MHKYIFPFGAVLSIISKVEKSNHHSGHSLHN
jgi:hypothetical protein